MRDHINVRVQRQTQPHSVTVRIEIQPVPEQGITAVPPELDNPDLVSRESLFKFLAQITRDEPDGGTVEARCLEIYEERLLKWLGVPGPVPDPVLVNLPLDV